MKKQVYTYQKQIDSPNPKFAPIILSLSRYTDSLLLFVNQTGTIGSIIQGTASESTAELAQPQSFQASHQVKPQFLYDIRVLFGSTEIQFYELLLRRVMGLLWEELGVGVGGSLARVVMNISLPVLNSEFKIEDYYGLIVEECSIGIKSVI